MRAVLLLNGGFTAYTFGSMAQLALRSTLATFLGVSLDAVTIDSFSDVTMSSRRLQAVGSVIAVSISVQPPWVGSSGAIGATASSIATGLAFLTSNSGGPAFVASLNTALVAANVSVMFTSVALAVSPPLPSPPSPPIFADPKAAVISFTVVFAMDFVRSYGVTWAEHDAFCNAFKTAITAAEPSALIMIDTVTPGSVRVDARVAFLSDGSGQVSISSCTVGSQSPCGRLLLMLQYFPAALFGTVPLFQFIAVRTERLSFALLGAVVNEVTPNAAGSAPDNSGQSLAGVVGGSVAGGIVLCLLPFLAIRSVRQRVFSRFFPMSSPPAAMTAPVETAAERAGAEVPNSSVVKLRSEALRQEALASLFLDCSTSGSDDDDDDDEENCVVTPASPTLLVHAGVTSVFSSRRQSVAREDEVADTASADDSKADGSLVVSTDSDAPSRSEAEEPERLDAACIESTEELEAEAEVVEVDLHAS